MKHYSINYNQPLSIYIPLSLVISPSYLIDSHEKPSNLHQTQGLRQPKRKATPGFPAPERTPPVSQCLRVAKVLGGHLKSCRGPWRCIDHADTLQIMELIYSIWLMVTCTYSTVLYITRYIYIHTHTIN